MEDKMKKKKETRILSAGQKIAKMWDELEDKDNWAQFEQFLKGCSETDLRQACQGNMNMLINICFSFYEDPGFDYVSQDFLKQMFSKMSYSDRKFLENQISQDIYLIAEDIYNDNKNTLKYFARCANYILKVGLYIKYCNPRDKKIEKEYNFIMSESIYYMNTKRIFE